MNSSSLKQRYKSAYHKTLQEKPAWKKEVIINSTGFNDRVVKEFCREVCELAESEIKLN
jgi:hypothetical protein